jgi:hypothetical protein
MHGYILFYFSLFEEPIDAQEDIFGKYHKVNLIRACMTTTEETCFTRVLQVREFRFYQFGKEGML